MDDIVYLTVGLIGGLLAVIAYFLKRRDQQIDDIQRKHDEKFERLYEKVSHIEKDVGEIPHLYNELRRIEAITRVHSEELEQIKTKL